ncbi:MAG: sensor domain-containing diguanylate cyclase [Chloroflexi bacterium]|nr:sensor domain-containing diguanylate cyclase [Chloroflexota bacterium]
MTPMRQEVKRVIKETLRERGIDTFEQDFIINLFDSVMATLNLDNDLKAEDMSKFREEISAHILSNHHLLSMLRQQSAELDTLRQLSLHLSSSLDLTTILRTVVSDAMDLLEDSRTAHIFLYNHEEDLLEFGAAHDKNGLKNSSYAEPRKNGLTYLVARGAKQIIVPNMHNHPIYENTPAEWHGSILGIPLKFESKVVGVMSISRASTGEFTDENLRFLDLLAEQAAIAISNARIHAQVRKQAKSDTLTGLPNRRALDEHLEEEIRSAHRTGHSFATIMMDLDGFKEVNDQYGHPIGDRVLRTLFNYLAQGLRTSDFLARYGGDELTLVLNKSDLPATKLVTEKIMEKLKDFSFSLPDGKKLIVGISGGIALYPIHGQTASQLLRAADEALYRSKKHERGSFTIASSPTGQLY